MRRLTERTEIAKAINYHEYPVIKIDIADRDDYGIKGSIVNIDCGDRFIHATLRTFKDEKKLTFHSGGTYLAAEVTYWDYMEMTDYANAPIVKEDQEILVFLYNSVTKDVYAPVILKTGANISRHCSTPLTLEKFILE